MPTLVSRSSSVESSSSAQAPRPFAPPTLSALVAQASAVQQARSRFLSTVNSSPGSSTAADDLALDDDDAVSTASSAAASVPSPQDRLEAEFAAAVHFVDSYQGPHRILKQENSTPKREFYALYQQATVGACPIATAPVGLSKLELARWEAWRALGRMPRHEAMQKYTTALDNLVDDWRRTAGINKPTNNLSDSVISTASTSSVGAASPSLSYQRQPIKKSASTFDRLPRIFDEFSELQARLEDETRKREELEAQLVTFTRENRTLISHELHQVDTMRGNLTELVKSLEEDVAQHYNELQLTIERQRKLQATLDRSIVLRAESRLHQIFTIVSSWTSHRLFRRVLLVLFLIRVWNFVRHRRMPQSFAQFLIRLISSASSLENTSSGATTRAVVRR